jgi:serine/threonine protein kinase
MLSFIYVYSNIMCETKLNATNLHLWAAHDNDKDLVNCVLGDFSSAWNEFADANIYTGGPSRAEQTDEYAPPEAIFGRSDLSSKSALVTPAFDSWSIGIVALELLMGTPNVFSVDQRTKAVLTHKLEKRGASAKYIDRALYL